MAPWNGSGTYTLSDTIAPATNADANELQAILTDIQDALTQCVNADGQKVMTGVLKGTDGTFSAPMYSFSSDANSGFYRIGSDNIGLSLGGTKRWDFGTAGATLTGTFTNTDTGLTPFVTTSTDAGASVGPILDLYRNSASPAVSDFIGSVDFNGRDSAANKQLYARLVAQITDPTSTSEDAILLLQQCIAGTLTTILSSSASALTTALKLSLTSTDSMAMANGTTAQRNGSPTSGDVRFNSTLACLEYYDGSQWIAPGKAPTVQRFTSGSAATYTPTSGMVRIRVRMCGGGGGGGAQATNNGTAGNATSFADWTANGGGAGPNGGATTAGGSGGSGGTNGTGTLINRVSGGNGDFSTNGAAAIGSAGGTSAFGVGTGRSSGNASGGNGIANSGGGGKGGGAAGTAYGGGGGGGEYVEFWMTAAEVGASKTYTVGAAANGGAAGTAAGGNGAAGVIIVEEFYS